MDRIDQRIAVSERARASADRWLGGDCEIVPNGVLIPDAGRPVGPRAHDRLRRPARAAQGPPGPAARLARDPPPHRGAARGRRRRPARRAAAPDAARRVPTTGIDIVGFLSQDELTDLLALDEGARRAVARRRELRHGADARVRVRARRSSHPTSRATARSSTPETAVPVPPGDPAALADAVDARCSPTSRAASRWARRRARSRAERLRAGPTSPRGSRGSTSASSEASERGGAPRDDASQALARNPWARGLLRPRLARRRRSSRSGGAGRSGTPSTTRSTSSRWRWVIVGVVLNLLSVLARALSWNLTIHQALPEPQPAVRAGVLGLRRRPARERRAPGPCRRARARRRALRGTCPARPGTSATLLGTVFAHRLFDLFPIALLVAYVLATAKIPHWAVTGLVIFGLVGLALLTVAMLSARRAGTRAASTAQRRRARCSRWRAQGLAVLRTPCRRRRGDPLPDRRLGAAAPRRLGGDGGVRPRRARSRRPRSCSC